MSTGTPETPVAATPPTPETVAEMLTAGDNDYHDGNYWKPSIGADGNVVHIGITAYSEDGEKLPEQHFRAVVVELPAYAVATEPVELPADLARELVYNPGDTMDGWTVVAIEYVESRRWQSVHRLVIHNEAGEHFASTFRQGLTEEQETQPFEDETTVIFAPVAPHFEVVTTWEAARAGGAA